MIKATRLPSLTTTLLISVASVVPSWAETLNAISLFREGKAAGKTGVARKTRPVDARPAQPGEIIMTIIKGQGVETRSKPAEPGDFVVRNRCPETGNEEYLVKAAKFPSRYVDARRESSAEGWREYLPQGREMDFYVIPDSQVPFEFVAPWGETMVAKPKDVLVQAPDDEADTYRVAAASFACTYEVVRAP